MISLKTAMAVHNQALAKYGGGSGVRDEGALQAALARPFATFDQIDLYVDSIEKAAAILESIVINHPFIDGNKRTAFVLADILLYQGGFTIVATEDEIYTMVIAASTGTIRFDEIKLWLTENTKQI